MRALRLISFVAVLLGGSASAQVISTNTTWSGAVALDRDVRIEPGVTVTVSPGATITAALSDAANLGTNAAEVEILVLGTLTINGTSGSVATFTSAGSSAGSWAGIRVEPSGTLTASNLVAEEAITAISSAGVTTLTGCTVRTNTFGVTPTAGTTNVATTLLLGNSYALYAQGGALSVDHSTIVANSYGVYSGVASGSVSVTNSIVSSNNSYGLYRSGSGVTISNNNNDVWQNSTDYNGVTAGGGSFSSNPLFVSGSNYRLTSNSPARKSDSGGLDLGALPYVADATPGLYGTLWINTTVSTSASVSGDLTVAPGVTLTVNPGVTLTMASGDLMLNANTSQTELIVRGTLNANGSTFTSTGSSAGSWGGLRVESSGSATLTGVTIEEASTGIDVFGPLTLSASTLKTNTFGVRANASTSTLTTTLFTGNSYAAYGTGGSLSVDHCTLVGNSYAVYSGSASGSVTVSNSVITSNNSYGLYRSGSGTTITNSFNDVWQNSADYNGATAGTGGFSANPLFVSASNYRLTSNSPARNSDSSGGDLGAFPYTGDATVGLVGTLWNNVTLATGALTGDVTIPAGVTVTVPAGVVLTAAAGDVLLSGNSSSQVELIVRGTLNITGTTGLPTTFSATGASAGSWAGVRVESTGTLSASSLVVERAAAGIESSGTVTLTGSTFRTNTFGVRINAGVTALSTSLFTGNSYAVYGSGGSVTVDHATLVSNSYAIYSGSTSGSVTVNNSVITNNNSYGLYRSGSGVSITNSYNDVWQNSTDYNGASAGTGSISSNPLFVSASNYRLTSNSPARKSDAVSADMGAFPYLSDATPGLYGTLWVNTTVSSSAALGGDLTVPAGITLTINSGVTLTAPNSDLMISGNSTAQTELIIRGTLNVNGTSASPVVFTSTQSSAGSWSGIRLESGATGTFTGAVIEEAAAGVENAGTLSLANSTLRTNTFGVRANGGSATIATSLFSGNSYAVYGSGGVLSVDHSTLVSNSYAIYSGATSGSVTVNNSVITNNNSYGLYRSGSGVSITNSYNDVWQNSTDYNGASAGTGSISSNPLFVSSNYRLTSNSPARRSDAMGGDMGAFPYTTDATAGLLGTLWSDTTLSANSNLLGDLTVSPGVTLTVLPGVTLTAATSDQMLSGQATSLVELIVRGTLSVNATPGNPAVFTSTGASAGSWTGIRVESGGAASLTGVTVSRASSGIEANSNVTLSDSTLTTNTFGLRANAGSTTATRTLFTGNSYAAYGSGGVLSVDHSTLVSNSYGIYSGTASGSVSVTNSVITNNNSYGLYRSGSGTNISNSYNDVWQNSTDYNGVTAGTGSISSNPLFVSANNFRLTSNSPARKSDSLAGDLGAFPYVSDATPGLVGTLWTSVTLSTSAALQGDLTVAPGVTVTVAPGVTLTAPSADLMISGSDPARTELIVLGTLQVSGTPASPVVLTATGASAGSWTGVRVLAGGSANLTSAVIQRGATCLELNANATVTSTRFNTCTFGVRSNTGTSTVGFSVFDGNSYGVYGSGGAITLDHATLYSNSYGVYSGTASGSVSVTNSIITNHSSYGLYRSGSGTTITNSYNLVFSSTTSGVTLGSNSLSVDPLLVAPASADFRLQSTSPARGAGTSASDLGAFPFAPGAVDRVVVTPVSATVTAGATFTFTATAYDVANNPVPGATITWSALGSAGVISSAGVLTASCTPGSLTNAITATANGRSGSANVTITTAPIASLVITPSNVNVRSQQSQQFTVTALDVCNNAVASPAVTWVATGSAGIIDAAGQYTAGCTRGAFPLSIVASAGSVSGRASVTVDPGVLSTVSLSPSSATLAVNGTRQFTGSAVDGCGNPLGSLITYATTVPGGNVNTSGLFSAGATPGTFNNGLTASASEGAITRAASANLTVTGGAVATVTVMPATATVPTGGVMNFMAVAGDSLGNMVAGTPTWSVVAGGGSITPSGGTFTAGALAGTFTNTVRATISGVSGFATVIVQPGAVTRVLIAPMNVTLAPSGNTTFTAQALDANDNPVTAAVTWSATTASGTITQGGVFTAGTMSGNYPAAVTGTVSGISGTASVSINAGALAQLTITPSVATTQAGGTVGFSATGRDGNGNTLLVTPVWTVVSGGGAISAAGVFSAGTVTGTFANTVRAESNGVTAFATVTVSPGPLSRLELTPSSATLEAGAMQQFSAVGQDAFGNAVSAAVTWSSNSNAGSITAGGLFTAGSNAGDYLDGVTATSGTVTATASIRVGVPVVTDAGIDAGMMDAGVDGGIVLSDAGMMESDAGPMVMPDGGSGTIVGKSGCGCSSGDAMAPLLGLLALAFRRRRQKS